MGICKSRWCSASHKIEAVILYKFILSTFTPYSWSRSMLLCSKNTQHWLIESKPFCSMTMQDLILLEWPRINFRNMRESNWCHIHHIVQTLLPWIITCFDSWLTSCSYNTSITKRGWKLQERSSLSWRTRTSISIISKNWLKDGETQWPLLLL